MSVESPEPQPARGLSDPMDRLAGGLYAFTGPGPMVTRTYVLTRDDPGPGAAPSFQDFWSDSILAGWCFFAPFDLSEMQGLDAFIASARRGFPTIDAGSGNFFLWLATPEDIDTPLAVEWTYITGNQANGNCGSTFGCDRFAVALTKTAGSLTLFLKPGLNGGPPSVQIYGPATNIRFMIDGAAQQVGLPLNPSDARRTNWVSDIALAGPKGGSLAMPLALDLGTLYAKFGCDTRFTYDPAEILDDKGTANTQALRMPLFAPQIPAPTGSSAFCAFDVVLNPLHPYDAAASGLRVDRFGRLLSGVADPGGTQAAEQVAVARRMLSAYGATSDGAVLGLTPADPLEESLSPDAYIGGGFAFSPPQSVLQGKAPASQTPLAPAGVFAASALHADGALPAAPAEITLGARAAASPALDIMPGLFALDFVRLAPGDRLGFVPHQPAFVGPPHETVATRAGLPDPDRDATTAYVTVVKGTAPDGRGYFGQSSTANLYLARDDAPAGLLSPTDARLSPLDKTPPFPMLFVGALFLQDDARTPINPGLTADLIGRLDQKAIGPMRHAALFDAPHGPVVQLPAPISGRMALGAEDTLQTHPVVTPQGYLVNVTPEGLFADITLGVGIGTTALRFAGNKGTPPLVDPEVSTLLTRENLFMVATKAGADWNFQDRILVAGFEFTVPLVQPDGLVNGLPAGKEKPAILIIKLDKRRSLRQMATDPGSWTNGGAYVGDVAPTVERLTALFKQADHRGTNKGEDPFAAFRVILDLKSWTGVIAFDAPIDGNGMPSDLQMLLGGIPNQLRAHHVGVQTNKLSDDKAGGTTVGQSSVFGVISYQNQPDEATSRDPLPRYEVAELIAQISNSAITQLHVTVDLILHTLLGREVRLPRTAEDPGGEILSIKGRYQKQGDAGRVTFVTDKAFVYTAERASDQIIRVVDSVHISHASLVPVTSKKGGKEDTNGDAHIEAHFVLDGEIFFDPSPFGAEHGVDLFSYGYTATAPAGAEPQGLMFTGLTVAVAFDLDATGTMKPGSKSVTLLEDSLKPTATPTAVRPNSLLGSLPLKLTGFEVGAKPGPGKSGAPATVGKGAKPVNVLQLMAAPTPKPVEAGTGDDKVAPPAMPVSPYVTAAPRYGLKYGISLGSLGDLSSAHAGISASLILGWGPSPTVPDNDAAAVMIELPSLAAGYQGFDLQGFVKTKFGDANLLKVDVTPTSTVYAISFDNVQLSVFGYSLPPGVLVDFLLFAGNQEGATEKVSDSSSIGWLLSATTDKKDGADGDETDDVAVPDEASTA